MKFFTVVHDSFFFGVNLLCEVGSNIFLVGCVFKVDRKAECVSSVINPYIHFFIRSQSPLYAVLYFFREFAEFFISFSFLRFSGFRSLEYFYCTVQRREKQFFFVNYWLTSVN